MKPNFLAAIIPQNLRQGVSVAKTISLIFLNINVRSNNIDFNLQPDLTAPGVQIVAAYSEATGPTDLQSDDRRVPFSIISGTSMSCPHVAGTIGLLKKIHPDWSPSALRSAIMTTGQYHILNFHRTYIV